MGARVDMEYRETPMKVQSFFGQSG